MGMYKKELERNDQNEEKFICEKCNEEFPISALCERNGQKFCPNDAKEYDNVFEKDK